MTFSPETVPLSTDAHGVVHVGKTRVTLAVVVAAYDQGASAEEIVRRYSVLELPDVHAVIAYYLRHTAEVRAYLQERQQQADLVRRENETRFPQQDLREKLLARRRPSPRS